MPLWRSHAPHLRLQGDSSTPHVVHRRLALSTPDGGLGLEAQQDVVQDVLVEHIESGRATRPLPAAVPCLRRARRLACVVLIVSTAWEFPASTLCRGQHILESGAGGLGGAVLLDEEEAWLAQAMPSHESSAVTVLYSIKGRHFSHKTSQVMNRPRARLLSPAER